MNCKLIAPLLALLFVVGLANAQSLGSSKGTDGQPGPSTTRPSQPYSGSSSRNSNSGNTDKGAAIRALGDALTKSWQEGEQASTSGGDSEPQKVSRCLTATMSDTGYLSFKNVCSSKITAAFCIERGNPTFNCQGGNVYRLRSLDPGDRSAMLNGHPTQSGYALSIGECEGDSISAEMSNGRFRYSCGSPTATASPENDRGQQKVVTSQEYAGDGNHNPVSQCVSLGRDARGAFRATNMCAENAVFVFCVKTRSSLPSEYSCAEGKYRISEFPAKRDVLLGTGESSELAELSWGICAARFLSLSSKPRFSKVTATAAGLRYVCSDTVSN
ncbi:hypothetical protein QF040_002875 [Variovorax sp. W2I14]